MDKMVRKDPMRRWHLSRSGQNSGWALGPSREVHCLQGKSCAEALRGVCLCFKTRSLEWPDLGKEGGATEHPVSWDSVLAG